MRRKGQLEGVEMDIDDGYPRRSIKGRTATEEILAYITPGFLQRVREVSESGKYDAIVTSGAIEPGFFAGRMISKIPIAFCVHSAVSCASLLRRPILDHTSARSGSFDGSALRRTIAVWATSWRA